MTSTDVPGQSDGHPPVGRPLDRLAGRIRDRTVVVGVVGLGYAGLPLAMAFAGHVPVVGIDLDPATVTTLVRGGSHVTDVPADEVASAVATGSFVPTGSFASMSTCDAVLVCVPTPLLDSREPDLSHVEAAVRSVAEHLRPGQLVVLESTTYPGTTDDLVRPVLESTGLALDTDFLLAFSSERVDPGNTDPVLIDVPKVVGGCSPRSTELAAELYAIAFATVHPVSSATVAELSKLLENTFRFVNIGLVNEVAEVCRHLGVDVREVIDAAATKPFGFMPFHPGPGIGGHCIDVDPYYLSWAAARMGLESHSIDAADRVNRAMPARVVALVEESLAREGGVLSGARILALGVTYKENVPDLRNSPAFPVISLLRAAGADVVYHDPFFPTPDDRDPGAQLPVGVELTDDELARDDAVVILTAHDGVPYDRVLRHARLVVDTRGCITPDQATRGSAIVVQL